MDTIYSALKAANCEIDSHESDLYVRDTETARTILVDWVRAGRVLSFSTFRCNRDGTSWLDIPFAYDPYWEQRAAARQAA